MIDQYLAKYTEDEIACIDNFPHNTYYQFSLVIPAYQESIAFITRFFSSQLADDNVLLIVVVNQPDYDTDLTPQRALFEQAQGLGSTTTLNETTVYVDVKNSVSDLLLINRFDQAIPQKKGVGLARKIGCDIACKFSHRNIVYSDFIASTDADAYLPDNYFKQQTLLTNSESSVKNKLQNNVSGACYHFTHILPKNADIHSHEDIEHTSVIHSATLQYEQALQYYVQGLKYANSPYAFFTIGSILLFNVAAYANVRGFPKKSAGEDFYLLNKLAKIGRIAYFPDSCVELTSRLSSRVPFGTGPAVQQIIDLSNNNKTYCYYAPAVFDELKLINDNITDLMAYNGLIDDYAMNQWFELLSNVSMEALYAIGFEKFIEQHKNNAPQQRCKQWLVWFDAFKTLKFIHAVRDIKHPNIALSEALLTKPF